MYFFNRNAVGNTAVCMCDRLMKSRSYRMKIEEWLFVLPICVYILKGNNNMVTLLELIEFSDWNLVDYRHWDLNYAKQRIESSYG